MRDLNNANFVQTTNVKPFDLFRCSNIDMWACKNNPCLHGGRCLPLPDGQHECVCPVSYEGDNCEDVNLCGPISCQNKGYCYTDGNSAR